MSRSPGAMLAAETLEAVSARARGALQERLGSTARWGAMGPGRINLIGEHTDYNQGFVLPMAIDRVTVAVGAPARDPSISRVHSVELNQTASMDQSRPLRVGEGGIERGSWMSYVGGVAAQFQALGPVPNLDIAIASSVPIGAGLSSSAAVEVAMATLLEQVLDTRLAPEAKARLCQRAEHDFAGVPCGLMDQTVSISGRAGHALLIDCRDLSVSAVPVPPEVVFMIANSGVRHALADGEYAKRRAVSSDAARKLGVPSLRDASLDQIARSSLNPEERRCAAHVISENARTLAAADALRAGDLSRLGQLMAESHASLRDDFRVSCAELDTLVALAAARDGVFGARMTGGGFGGCIVTAVRSDRVNSVATAIGDGYERSHARRCEVYSAKPSGGAAAL